MSTQLTPEQRSLNLNSAPVYDPSTYAYTLTLKLINENPNWPIIHLYNYCNQFYKTFGFNRAVFNDACRAYINQLP